MSFSPDLTSIHSEEKQDIYQRATQLMEQRFNERIRYLLRNGHDADQIAHIQEEQVRLGFLQPLFPRDSYCPLI